MYFPQKLVEIIHINRQQSYILFTVGHCRRSINDFLVLILKMLKLLWDPRDDCCNSHEFQPLNKNIQQNIARTWSNNVLFLHFSVLSSLIRSSNSLISCEFESNWLDVTKCGVFVWYLVTILHSRDHKKRNNVRIHYVEGGWFCSFLQGKQHPKL